MKHFNPKTLLKVAALFSCCAVCMTELPTAVLAVAPTADEETVTVVREEAENRSEFVKHYLCSDGSHIAQVYASPVHYENNGAWVDVNNQIQYDEKADVYANTENPTFRVEFPATYGAAEKSPMVTFVEDEGFSYQLQFLSNGKPLTTSDTQKCPEYYTGKAVDPVGKSVEDTSAFILPNTTGKISYPGLYQSVNLEYAIAQGKVQQTVEMEEAAFDSLKLTIPTNGCTAQKMEGSNTVQIVNQEGEVTYQITSPSICDQTLRESFAISVNISNRANEIVIEYTIDEMVEDIQYPVNLIMATGLTKTETSFSDTYLIQQESYDHSSESYFYAGCYNKNNTGKKKYHSFIKVNNAYLILPNNAIRVTKLVLHLELVQANSGYSFGIFEVFQQWRADSSTGGLYVYQCNNGLGPSRNSVPIATEPFSGASYNFIITNSVLAQVLINRNESHNLGFALCYAADVVDTIATNDSAMSGIDDYNKFFSHDYVSVNPISKLTITYNT